MRQRLYRGDAYKSRKLQVDSTNVIPPTTEVILEERVVFPVEGRHLFKPAHARNLLRQYTMQLRVDPVCLDRYRDELSDRLLDGLIHRLRQFTLNNSPDVLIVAVDEGSNERFLARIF